MTDGSPKPQQQRLPDGALSRGFRPASRWLAGFALVTSLLLGANLAWNVYETQPPVPEPAAPRQQPAPVANADLAPAVARREPAPQNKPDHSQARPGEGQARPVREQDRVAASAQSEHAPAPSAPLSEPEKIERLIRFVAALENAVFIRNGREYPAADAAAHLRRKRERAGDRVQTADDFIRLCASFSSQSGAAYLIRLADGRTRTAEDVLREQLAALSGP